MTLNAQLHHNEKLVADWNAAHPVGTRVSVTLDGGRRAESVTRSPAWVLGEHSAVVYVDCVNGPYSLSRVRPLPGRYRGA